MQVKQFEYVRAVAEKRSITRAADTLFISQQALSETLKLLEDELGFKIFSRSNKGVVPTKAGEKLLQDLEQIMPVIYSWKHLAEENREKRVVKIFIQYILSDLLITANLLDALERHTENIMIEWEAINGKDLFKQITMGDFDIAIAYLENRGGLPTINCRSLQISLRLL